MSSTRALMINAVRTSAEAEIADGLALAAVYLDHPVGIGEHPQVTEELRKIINQIASAEDAIKVLDTHFKNPQV